MRSLILAVLVLCALAIPARAQLEIEDSSPPSGPPSRTLERAIKLYDKRDFFSASIELTKVLQGEKRADRAWQTTPAAGEVLQELTVLQSLQMAEIGAFVRQRCSRSRTGSMRSKPRSGALRLHSRCQQVRTASWS